MQCFKNHRRKLIKKNYIKGTRATAKCDGSSVILESTLNTHLCKLEIDGNTEQNQMPSPDNFQEIKNVGDNGLEIKIRGRNLFNEELLLEGIYNYKPNNPRPKEPDVVKTDEGYEIFGYYVTYYGADNPLLLHLKKTIKPDVEYTFVRNTKSIGSGTAGAVVIYVSGKPAFSFGASTNGKLAKSFKLSQEQIDNISHFYIYGTRLADRNEGGAKTIFEYIQLVEGSYTKDNAPPYESYIEPTTASLDITLCGIDGYNDTLSVDFTNKKAVKTERVLYRGVSDLIEEYGATIHESENAWAIYIENVPARKSIDGEMLTYYCTHFTSYHSGYQLGAENPCFEVAHDNILWFYYPPQKSVDEFKQWCSDNDVKIAYVLEQEKTVNLPIDDFVNPIFKLKPCEKTAMILETTSDVAASRINVEYYSYEKEDNHSLTIHYKDKEGKAVLEDKVDTVRHESIYQIIAPEIEEYKPENNSIKGYMIGDREITIIYNKK